VNAKTLRHQNLSKYRGLKGRVFVSKRRQVTEGRKRPNIDGLHNLYSLQNIVRERVWNCHGG